MGAGACTYMNEASGGERHEPLYVSEHEEGKMATDCFHV